MIKKLAIMTLLFVGCEREEAIIINNLDIDFPTVENVEWSQKQIFAFPESGAGERIKDSLLFVFGGESNPDTEYGDCYNINNGNKIATVIGIGRAKNEMKKPSRSRRFIANDSIQITDFNNRIIRQFSINDIITKPLSERSGSTIELKEFDFALSTTIKLDNGLMFGDGVCEKSKTNYFTYDGKEIKKFNTINKKILESKNRSKSISINSHFISRGDKVVTASHRGVALTIIDSKTGEVINERYYNKYKVDENRSTPIDSNYYCVDINCDDNYLYVVVINENREKGKRLNATYQLYVFDWGLNPVKRYHLSNESDYYSISADCTHMYYLKGDGDHSVLYEAKIQ